jgi:hypothetical protein
MPLDLDEIVRPSSVTNDAIRSLNRNRARVVPFGWKHRDVVAPRPVRTTAIPL